MISDAPLFVCETCLRQHDGQGGVVPFQMVYRDEKPCGLRDCKSLAAVRRESDERAALQRREARGARREARTCQPKAHRPQPTAHFRSSCPRDTEPMEQNPEVRSEKLEFSEAEGARFAAAPEREKEAALDVENQCAALHEFLRKNFGRWFDNGFLTAHLKQVLKVSNLHLNNIASKLRARLEEEGLALDVDSRAATPTVWEYRLCLKKDSVRLLRPNPERRATD